MRLIQPAAAAEQKRTAAEFGDLGPKQRLAPAGRQYRARAEGGAVRYIRVAIDPTLLPIDASARPLASHDDPAMAALVRALADDDHSAAEPLLALLAVQPDG